MYIYIHTHTTPAQAVKAAIAAAGVRRAKFVQKTEPAVVHPKRKKHLVEKESNGPCKAVVVCIFTYVMI